MSTGFQWNIISWKSQLNENSIIMKPWHEEWLVDEWFFYLLVSSGIFVLIGAVILVKSSQNELIGSILVIIFSISGLFGIGVSFLGGMFGIIGAIYALSERRNRINNANAPL